MSQLLLGEKDEATFNVVPSKATIDEIEEKTTKSTDDKKILKLQELNKIAYMHLVLSIDTSTREGKAAFRLIKNTKSPEYPDGNCKLAWDRLRFRYASMASTSLKRLKKIFENNLLKSKWSDPDMWVSYLESIISEIKAIENLFNDSTLALKHVREKLSG